jgi:hypothetical protein
MVQIIPSNRFHRKATQREVPKNSIAPTQVYPLIADIQGHLSGLICLRTTQEFKFSIVPLQTATLQFTRFYLLRSQYGSVYHVAEWCALEAVLELLR